MQHYIGHGTIKARILCIFTSVAVMLVQFVCFDSTAEARCNGAGGRTTSTLVVDSTVYVTEVPVEGTCNGNDYYQASFRSNHSGWRASVWIYNDGTWKGYYGGFGTNWHSYEYRDDNSHSYIHLCLDDGSRVFCGWGNSWSFGNNISHANYGVNHGF